MTYYCCTWKVDKTIISRFVPTKNEVNEIASKVKRQGHNPSKTVITVSEESTRTETVLR